MERLDEEVKKLVEKLKADQQTDGSWNYCFESGPMTDAYMIILLTLLNTDDESLISELASRLWRMQEANGAWKLFYDEEEGNLSATVEAYFALEFIQYKPYNHPKMKAARQFIKKKGGITEVHSTTKYMLAVTGQIHWSHLPTVPIEYLLLPPNFPLSFYHFVGYARVHLAPFLILSSKEFTFINKKTPDLSHLLLRSSNQTHSFSTEERSVLSSITESIKDLIGLPHHLHQKALKKAESYMLKRIEPDGTLYSYFSATFFMIFALLAIGYPKDHTIIQSAVNGLKTFTCKSTKGTHIQNSTATVWDTSLISNSMQAAGVNPLDSSIKKAEHFLLKKQQYLYGDWVFNNPDALPGGWGFSRSNTINPDVDDTTAALRSLKGELVPNPYVRQAWDRGLNWVLSMQNDDGGWPAFEKNTDNKLLTLIPLDNADSAAIDPSTADLTGRTLEYLGKEANLTTLHPQVQKGVRWLRKNQQTNGSWYGRWGICYIYGTWAALTGLRAVGMREDHLTVKKGVEWLQSIQNPDGGWGESCYSDIKRTYIPLGESTLSQTSWAVDAVIASSSRNNRYIQKGINSILNQLQEEDWTKTYPTGAGLPSSFYIHYHSYNYIWPLLALSNYKMKFGS